MNVAEGWNMYLDIQSLKDMHFNVSQISRRLDLSRTTVYRYLNMNPKEYEQVLENRSTRTKKLDKQWDKIRSWLIQYPDVTSAQVLNGYRRMYLRQPLLFSLGQPNIYKVAICHWYHYYCIYAP